VIFFVYSLDEVTDLVKQPSHTLPPHSKKKHIIWKRYFFFLEINKILVSLEIFNEAGSVTMNKKCFPKVFSTSK